MSRLVGLIEELSDVMGAGMSRIDIARVDGERADLTKAEILLRIQAMAERNGGRPPGRKAFQRETGLAERAWSGLHWVSWGDAVREAGYRPNTLRQPYSDEFRASCLAKVIRERGRFPTRAELIHRRQREPTFPSPTAFFRRKSKRRLIGWLSRFCQGKPEYADVAEVCAREMAAAQQQAGAQANNVQAGQRDQQPVIAGVIYLLKCATQYKIGCTTDLRRRQREINAHNPGRVRLVHRIQTDDLRGLEAYWHKRFHDKRIKGEWFQLTAADVAAFKRREFM